MEDDLCYVLVWVDDIIIGCKNKGRIKKLREDFNQRFRMDDRGPLSWFLGMVIKRQPGAVTVSQTQYNDECLRQFGLDDCKPVSTPADVNNSFSRADCPKDGSTEAAEMEGCDYRAIEGCLLYIAKQTRPDILAIVSKLSRYLENPGKVHWMAAKRVLQYLKGTRELGLTFRRDADGLQLLGACDADWASDVDDRRSPNGFAFRIQ